MRRAVLPHLILVFASSLGVLDPRPAPCQEPPPAGGMDDLGPALGQPARRRLGLGPLVGYDYLNDRTEARFFLNAEGRVAMPQFGLLDVNLEGALDVDNHGVGTALGTYLKLPYVRVGVERDFDEGRYDLVLSAQGSLRRGGMFHHGERLRLDYSPTRPRIQLGFVFHTPWTRYRSTRPFRRHLDLPEGQLPATIAADASRVATDELARVEHSIEWLDRMLTPNLTPNGYSSTKSRQEFERQLDTVVGHHRLPGHSFSAEDSTYHAMLEVVFVRAAGGDAEAGRSLADAARLVLYQEIVVPFNRQFGRARRPEGLGGLGRIAQDRFDQIVRTSDAMLDESGQLAARESFRRIVGRIDRSMRAAAKRWGDTALAWMPLNYGLRAEDRDSQAEIETITGRLVGGPFTSGNSVNYVLNDQFHPLLRQTIRDTREFHVLWIHDFRGLNSLREEDRVAWTQVARGYIDAMTAAIGALDRGERRDLPVFVVFLDEHYYQVNASRRLITLLERLSTAETPELKNPALREEIATALERLREAIRSSPELARRGPEYVQRRVRVQIHITYPMDPAFAGDILMRDHRKIAFCDVTEEDPTSGCGVFTGQGIGEHYQGPDWEDRSLVLRGPELVKLKIAARRLLRSQGFDEEEIPRCLRSRPYPANEDSVRAQLDERGWLSQALIAMNETGWGPKPATVLKAVLYNLMPSGGTLVAPDSLWTSDFWAGMFFAAALRGCRVYVIAPAADHAPSSSLPTLGLMRETLASLLEASRRIHPDLLASGGELRVGLYTRKSDVNDMRAMLGSLLEVCRNRSVAFPALRFHPDVLRALEAEHDTLTTSYAGPAHPWTSDGPNHPQIHLKAQFFASREGLGILSRPEWGPILSRYLVIRRRQTSDPQQDIESITDALMIPSGAEGPTAQNIVALHADSLRGIEKGAQERILYFATIGSHNQDRRSMMLDGEVLVAISGGAALTTAIDFACLVATATWPRNAAELEAYFPESPGLMARVQRWIQNLI
ncbi:MAG: hypothetical protein ACREOU_00680 [Candidatus Eiseniibacteriota bacterium]